jgi:hypothetical protein
LYQTTQEVIDKDIEGYFYVFDLFATKELFDRIQALLPFQDHKVNWGI